MLLALAKRQKCDIICKNNIDNDCACACTPHVVRLKRIHRQTIAWLIVWDRVIVTNACNAIEKIQSFNMERVYEMSTQNPQ